MVIGSLIAPLAIAYTGVATRRALPVGGAGFSLLLLGVGLSHWRALTVPILLGLGISSSLFTATSNARLQLLTLANLRGRVMSMYTLLFNGSTPIGSLLVGFLAERQGVSAAISGMAVICLLGVAAGLLYPRRHRPRLMPDGSRTCAPVAALTAAIAAAQSAVAGETRSNLTAPWLSAVGGRHPARAAGCAARPLCRHARGRSWLPSVLPVLEPVACDAVLRLCQ